ncbi:MAG TPA: fatty acid--CoA ligase family protein [Acidimicrobiales bacterium]|nr:fatty acid--CoA ligase family protein [Acidimicrobiales bacterium]
MTDSLANLLLDHPFADGRDLLCTVDGALTAGAARAEARATAARLTDAGIEPGHGVAVQLPSGPELVTAMAGIWMAGAVFVPLNDRSPDAEIRHVLDTIRPAALLGGDGLRLLDGPLRHDLGVAFVTWTSGTTGPPKAILQSHGGYLELLDRVLRPLRGDGGRGDAPREPTPNLVPVSVALNAGIYNVCFGLRAGAAVVLMGRFSTADFSELVHRYQIRSTVLPPAAMVMLTDDLAVSDLSPLRFVRSITAPLSPLAARRFMERFGVTVLNSYGQAEVGEVVGWTAADAREHPEKLGAAGRPHEGVDIRVVDADGTDVTPGSVGELLVRPPRMAAGYAGGASLDDRVDDAGFLRTGDHARVDPEGFVWIEGRTSDLINRGGNKVFPEQVEEVLRLVPGVSDAAVVGRPDDRLGEVPVAFVVGAAPEDAMDAACRAELSPYKVPVAYHRIEALPRNEVGKLLRRQLVPPLDAAVVGRAG